MKKIILLKPYHLLPAGSQMAVPPGVAEELIRRRVARDAEEEPEKKPTKPDVQKVTRKARK